MNETEKRIHQEKKYFDEFGKDKKLDHIFEEIRCQSNLLKLNMQKRDGIQPSELAYSDILLSIQEGNVNSHNDDTFESQSWTDMIIVSKKNSVYAI